MDDGFSTELRKYIDQRVDAGIAVMMRTRLLTIVIAFLFGILLDAFLSRWWGL